jgi:hypothetical protein
MANPHAVAIRTAVVTMSPMLRDIIKGLRTGGARLEIVAEFTTRDQLVDRLKAILPDMVLIGFARGETDRIAHTILIALPHSKVVGFSGGGRRVYIHEMRPHRKALANVSAKAVISAIYSRVNRRGFRSRALKI